MKKTISFLALLSLATFISGCSLFQPIAKDQSNANQTVNLAEPAKTTISFLVSTEDVSKYCNGGDMDSAGFRKTITKTLTKDAASANLPRNELIKQTIVAASEEENLTTITQGPAADDFLKIAGDTAYLAPIDGWAGVSIFLCAWKPLVEVNLLSFPEIKNIVWQALNQ